MIDMNPAMRDELATELHRARLAEAGRRRDHQALADGQPDPKRTGAVRTTAAGIARAVRAALIGGVGWPTLGARGTHPD